METYLPLIKTLFADWVQLTINEPLYAGALAVIAWLLTACLYSIKVAILNRKSTARENARIDAINQLSAAQLQVQDMQQQLVVATEQIKKYQELAKNETQRASNSEDQLKDRNKSCSWVRLREILSVQQRVTATFQQRGGNTLHIRKATVAEAKLKEIYGIFKISATPGGTKKMIA